MAEISNTNNNEDALQIPDDLSSYVPAHLISLWISNGGCLLESDFAETNLGENGRGYQLSEMEEARYASYKRKRTNADRIRARFLLGERSKAYSESTAGKEERTARVQESARHDAKMLLKLAPFFAFVTQSLHDQPEFLTWMNSIENRDFLSGIILGKTVNYGQGPTLVFDQPISTVGAGFLLNIAHTKIRNMARLKGISETYPFEDSAQAILVAKGFLDLQAGRMRPKELLRGFKLDSIEPLEDTWSNEIPELEGWTDAPKILGTEPPDAETKQVADLAFQGANQSVGENYRIAILLLRDAFKAIQE